MVGFAIDEATFGEYMVRGQGVLHRPGMHFGKNDKFAFVVWPLGEPTMIHGMRCGVGKVERDDGEYGRRTMDVHWERLGVEFTPEEIESIGENLVRLDKPIKYD